MRTMEKANGKDKWQGEMSKITKLLEKKHKQSKDIKKLMKENEYFYFKLQQQEKVLFRYD